MRGEEQYRARGQPTPCASGETTGGCGERLPIEGEQHAGGELTQVGEPIQAGEGTHELDRENHSSEGNPMTRTIPGDEQICGQEEREEHLPFQRPQRRIQAAGTVNQQGGPQRDLTEPMRRCDVLVEPLATARDAVPDDNQGGDEREDQAGDRREVQTHDPPRVVTEPVDGPSRRGRKRENETRENEEDDHGFRPAHSRCSGVQKNAYETGVNVVSAG